jgi:hypothetical protein
MERIGWRWRGKNGRDRVETEGQDGWVEVAMCVAAMREEMCG